MSFRDLKAAARRRVHSAFGVPCLYGAGAVPITARFHNKMVIGGDISGDGYASIIEGVTRIVFNREELAAADDGLGVVPSRGGRVVFPDYIKPGENLVVELDARDPYEGPVTEKWSAVVVV